MERILITGGAGFIGSNACNILSKEGYEVIAFDNLSLGRKRNLEEGVTFINGDLANAEDLEQVGQVDYVIHLAASSSAPMFVDDLIGSFENNIVNHMRVLEYARTHGAKKIIFASTSSIYGNNPVPLTEDQDVTPPNMYSVTKHAQEEASQVYAEMHELEIIAFRFMSVYGLHEEHKGRFANLISQFMWGMEQGRQPTVYGDGLQTRDFTNVKDIVQAFRHAIKKEGGFGFSVYNVGTSQAINMHDLMKILNHAMGTKIEAALVENPIKTGYVKNQLGSLEKINRELGYEPTVSLEEGVKEIVEHRKTDPIAPASMSY
ncbi:MAG: NAD-dependent epimerase/dehydratase family protein [bacterium]